MKNIVILILGVLLVITLNVTFVFAQCCGQDQDKCPMKKIKDGEWCKKCDKILEKEDKTDDGKCKKCGEEPKKVKVCEMEAYRCKDCDEISSKPGKCPGCNKKMEKYTDKARIVYECKKCEEQYDNEGECPKCKEKLKKVCSKAGEEPHKMARQDQRRRVIVQIGPGGPQPVPEQPEEEEEEEEK
jgi:hypothetical protein